MPCFSIGVSDAYLFGSFHLRVFRVIASLLQIERGRILVHFCIRGVEIRKMHFKVHGNLNRWPKRVWLEYALFDLAIPPQFPPHFFMIFKSCAGKFLPWLHFPQFTNISKEKEKVENGRFSEPERASTEFMPASTFPVWEKIKAEKKKWRESSWKYDPNWPADAVPLSSLSLSPTPYHAWENSLRF